MQRDVEMKLTSGAAHKRRSICRKRKRGAATIEYIVACLAVMAALFLPVLPAEGGGGSESAAVMLINALKSSTESYHWAMAVPT